MALLRVATRHLAAVEAAERFYRDELAGLKAELAKAPRHCTLIFPPADHSHRAWRLAAVQSLAREYAPIRVNAVVSDSDTAIAAVLAYLASAEGVTGQLLDLDDTGAGAVVSSPS